MLDPRRHFAWLCGFVAALALVRPGRLMPGIGGEFALYGALHACALALSLTPGTACTTGRKVLLVAGGALLSLLIARLGFVAITGLAARGAPGGPLPVLAAAAALGALAYGMLIRQLVDLRPSVRSLVAISLGCAAAVGMSFAVARRFHAAAALWLVIPWWLAFSGGLWCATYPGHAAPPARDAISSRSR